MQRVILLAALIFAGCGDSPQYQPGTLPDTLTFKVVRVYDAEHEGAAARRLETELYGVGQPVPDAFDGRTAAWRCRTLFGDLVDHPGASLELHGGGATLSKEDPWRIAAGTEFCLVVGPEGAATVQWVDLASVDDVVLIPGWDAAEVRLRLDQSGFAAHRQPACSGSTCGLEPTPWAS